MVDTVQWLEHLKNRRKFLGDFLGSDCAVAKIKAMEPASSPTSFTVPRIDSLKKLKVAAIMDAFTLGCFSPECEICELTPSDWMDEIDAFQPDLVFIESAWRGKGNLWRHKICPISPEFYQLAAYCHQLNLPLVFWSKEDPVHFKDFISIARQADFVFTTDAESVRKYRELLGHENVHFLAFAAQPALHNPIEKYERKDKFCFAGSYVNMYPERCRLFDEFSEIFHCCPKRTFPKTFVRTFSSN